jgi:putative aldouronate transport system substrate-binding protein
MKIGKVLGVMSVFFLLASFTWANGAGDTKPAETAPSTGPLEISMTCRLLDPVPDMNNAYWKAYQEKANVKLNVEWVPDGDYLNKLNLKFSSNDLTEVTTANLSTSPNNPAFINAVQNGAFWELTGFLDDFSKYPNLKNNVAPDAWTTTKVLGKNYGVPRNQNRVQGTPMIRVDLVKETGQQIPTTTSELLTVVENILKKYPQMIGILSKQDMFLGESSGISAAFGATKPEFNSEGGLIYTKLNKAYTTKYVAFMREAYRRGLLSKEFMSMRANTATEHFQSGNGVVFLNESGRWTWPFTQTLKTKGFVNAEVNVMPPLEGEKGLYAVLLGTGVLDSFFISKKVPEQKVTRILDYFERVTTDDYYEIINFGVEGIHFNWVNGERVVTPQRNKDMGASCPWQVLPMKYNPYQKVGSPSAPEAYNKQQVEQFDAMGWEKKGIMDPFQVVTSSKWAQIWPRYQSAWATKAVQATVGEISMADFDAYVNTINNDPDIKAAYREFGDQYRAMYGNK